MNLIGQTIRHNVFGSGVITDLSEETVTICFQNIEKRFIYPDAFRSFLVLNNQKTQQHIEAEIKKRDMEAKMIREIEQTEYERKHKSLNFKITPKAHAVFDIPSDQIDQVIRLGQVSTGTYLSGYAKGKPRVAGRMKPNSVCLLTTCQKGQPEKSRSIIGAFMVAEDFFGEDAHDGVINGHTQHRILTPQYSCILFWQYFEQEAPLRWGSTPFKYCSGDTANIILADLTARFAETEQKETAIGFYEYFCKSNHLRSRICFQDND